MKINIHNLIFQLLPVARRQTNRLSVLYSFIDLVRTNELYVIWQTKYSRILRANAQVVKLQRYLRDVFTDETIFIKERMSGKMRVVLKIEKINNELILGLHSAGENKQYLRLSVESGDSNYADYIIVYPKKISKELLIIELQRFNPVMKKYQFKELL